MNDTFWGAVALLVVILIFVWVMGSGDRVEEARTYPNPDGWVTDVSNVLDPQVKELVSDMAEGYKDANGHEIAVLLVPTTNGETIEDYSINLAERWEVGNADNDDGVILIIVTEDRKVRIEVGYGLEDKLTDARTGRLLDEVIVPHLKENDWNEAVRSGVEAINKALMEI